MLPSMPVLFTRDSQDAFGNKIEPSTSFFNQNKFLKPIINPEPPPQKVLEPVIPVKPNIKEAKPKANVKKKEEPPKFDNNALEIALVRSYYTKVQSRFTNPSVPNNKFIQFQNILKTFDPSKETPVELYKKIEGVFGEEHKDILEDFLLFLKPGQAAKVGRFMDHFMMVQITSFIEMLQSAFYRKPTVLRKILRTITTGLNSGSCADMKTRVLPHLRSNPRLSQMFKSLFPDERPPDSAYETGADTIHESFLTADKGFDVWEFEEADNKKKIDASEGLDTMYLHGRVFLQHGRLLRSATVTYPYSKEPYRVHSRRLAPAHCHLSPPDSDDERASPKRTKTASKIPPKKTKKQLKSPTKNVKDVNDNTKVKDLVANALSSPKAVKKTQKKSCKEKKEDKPDTQKRERKDSKNSNCQKRDEGSKPKQAKLQPSLCVEAQPVCSEVKSVSIETTSVFTEVKPLCTDVKPLCTEGKPVCTERKPLCTVAKPVCKESKPIRIEAKPICTESKPICTEARPEVKRNSWTRDEDKTMLQVLKVEADSELVFGRVRELLPHRSETEIKERFCHVINLLQQMAVGEVT